MKPAKTTYKTTYKTNKTNQNDPKQATIYPNTTGLRDICIDGVVTKRRNDLQPPKTI